MKHFLRISLFLCALQYRLTALEQWTEEDETKRLTQLKQEEKRLFELEMRGQSIYGSSMAHNRYNDGYGSSSGFKEGFGSTYGGSSEYGGSADYYRSEIKPFPVSRPSSLASKRPLSTRITKTPQRESWCFYCASPLNSVSDTMQQVIKNFLEVRRADFPRDVVVDNCANPKDISTLPKQKCLHSYCQTLILTDHDSASAFTLRGCAEQFGAINEIALEQRGDNVCKKLHNTVDIQECICKHRKYCYAGAERNIAYGNEDTFVVEEPLRSFSNGFNTQSPAFTLLLAICLLLTSLI
jgi:hypothetical protein